MHHFHHRTVSTTLSNWTESDEGGGSRIPDLNPYICQHVDSSNERKVESNEFHRRIIRGIMQRGGAYTRCKIAERTLSVFWMTSCDVDDYRTWASNASFSRRWAYRGLKTTEEGNEASAWWNMGSPMVPRCLRMNVLR